jgi:hypothetical protein
MADKLPGIGGDDFVKYSVTGGRFPEVLAYLNSKFTAETIRGTKDEWEKYVKSLGGDAKKHLFGRFAAHLLEGLFSQESSRGKAYPTRQEWLADCTTYNGRAIDPIAFKAMADALRENLQQDEPFPMYFAVAPSETGMHEVVKTTGDIGGGVRGILVTMKCPAAAA